MRTLFAAVQSRAALRAIAAKVDIGRQHGGTVITTRRRYSLHHAREARSGDIDRRAWTLRARTLFACGSAVSGIVAAGILVAALPVLAFAVHTFLVGLLLTFVRRRELIQGS